MPSIPPLDPNFETSIEELCQPLPKKKRVLKRFFLLFVPIVVIFTILLCTKHEISKPLVFLKGPCPDFVGRKEILDILYQDLLRGKTKKEYHHAALIKVLWGMGGYGKSEIAIEFANRYLAQFSLIWTFYCDSQEHIDQGYRLLAQKLELLNPGESLEKVKERVHFYLENESQSLPWLLIYDNVEEEFTDLPQRGGVVLITSQKKILNPEYLLEVTPFQKNEAIQLLEKITGESLSPMMEELVNDLEGIPLLLNYAAHYIKATPGCDIEDYQQIFSSNLPLWNHIDVNQRYLKSLATSWQFPLKTLEKVSPLALKWLYVCSYLSPEYIPEYWIDGEARIKKDILSALCNFGIVRYDAETETFSIHRFFQYMIRESRKNYLEEDLKQAVELLAKHARDYKFSDFSTWNQGRLWYLHATELLKRLVSSSVHHSLTLEKAHLFEGIGEWCAFNFRFEEAVHAHQNALQLRKSSLPENDIDIGLSHARLGWALYNASRFEEALQACQNALQILPRYSDHRNWVAIIFNIKGLTLGDLGEYEESLRCHLKALDIRLKILDIPNLENDIIVNALIKIREKVIDLRRSQQLSEALQLHERIVDVARSLNNIGRCYGYLKKYALASEFLDSALQVYEKNCGKEHPLYSRTLRTKGFELIEQGKYSQALKIFEQTLSIGVPKTGKNFAELSYSWIGIGWSHFYQKNYKKASTAFKNARNIMKDHNEKILYEIKCYRGLCLSYLKTGHIDKGLKYLTQWIERCSTVFRTSPKMENCFKEFLEALNEAKAAGATKEQLTGPLVLGQKLCQEAFGKDHNLTFQLSEQHLGQPL